MESYTIKMNIIICLNIWDQVWCVLFCNFFYCCPHFYCDELKHVSVTVSFGLPHVSLVYQGIEMTPPGKSFLKFDYWSNKMFKNYDMDIIRYYLLLDFRALKLLSKIEYQTVYTKFLKVYFQTKLDLVLLFTHTLTHNQSHPLVAIFL